MALTLRVEQRLERAKLIQFFEHKKATWVALARKVYQFVSENYPNGAAIRRDDVAENLLPFVNVNDDLTNELDKHKLKQKYWRQDFCDLIIDRCWDTIAEEDDDDR
jgi:hypothetical protein